jgi:hypothetical protein
LYETISVTKSRSTKEMEETINMTDKTTQGIADKLTSIRTRIRDKSETLKQHHQLVCIKKIYILINKYIKIINQLLITHSHIYLRAFMLLLTNP